MPAGFADQFSPRANLGRDNASGGADADADLLGVAEVRELPQLSEQVVDHEAQARRTGRVLAYDNDHGTADLGDAAIPAQRLRQQRLKLSRPGLLIRGTSEKVLQRGKSPVALVQKFNYLAAGHSVVCRFMNYWRIRTNMNA